MKAPRTNKAEQIIIGLVVTVILLCAVFAYIESPRFFPPKTKLAVDYATVTVTFSNGQTETLDSRYPSLAPLTILVSGAAISSINTNLYMTPTFTGTVSSYTVSATYGVSIQDMTTDAYVYTYDMAMSPVSPLPTLSSGNSVIICSSTVSASALQSLYSAWVSGRTYTLMDSANSPTMTITFTDGLTLSQTGTTATIKLTFEYHS
jgi:hypothetical protein